MLRPRTRHAPRAPLPIGILGGQAGPAREMLVGVARAISQGLAWELHTRTWIGLPPLFDLAAFRGAGILYLGPDIFRGASPVAAVQKQLARLHCPIVYAAVPGDQPALPCVLADEQAVGRLQAEHLLDMGYRHLAYFADEDHPWDLESRLQGFRAAAARAGVPCDVFFLERPWCTTPWATLQKLLHEWLRTLPHPVGIGVCTDPRAAFLLHTARRYSLRVPEHLAVIGAGHDPVVSQCVRPELSSIAIPWTRIGAEAAALLQAILDGQAPPATPQLVAPTGVVARQSSEHLAIDDPLVVDCLAHIRDHPGAGLRVKELLAVARVSPRNLELRFRRALGRTPSEEIRRQQINLVKRLLVETDLSMSQIARAGGYANQSRFGTAFRRLAGVTPTLYRQQVRARNRGRDAAHEVNGNGNGRGLRAANHAGGTETIV